MVYRRKYTYKPRRYTKRTVRSSKRYVRRPVRRGVQNKLSKAQRGAVSTYRANNQGLQQNALTNMMKAITALTEIAKSK